MLSSSFAETIRIFCRTWIVWASLLLAACQFQPLHGSQSAKPTNVGGLSAVSVSQVNSRVAQQVRNHLLFLLNGGFDSVEKTHEARIRVTWYNTQQAAIQGVRDNVSGTITVVASYDLIDLSSGKSIGNGSRQTQAYYDRTGQVFANKRAEIDAENRAAKEAAESLRSAIASELSRTQS